MSWDGALQAHAVMSTQAGHEEDIKLVSTKTVKKQHKLAYQ